MGIFLKYQIIHEMVYFAPVFFILGGIISNKSNYMSTKNSLIGFLISFLLMLCEGMFLHKLGYSVMIACILCYCHVCISYLQP